MIWRKEKLVLAAMLIAAFLPGRAAGAATISYTPDEYLVFAGRNLQIGTSSQVWGRTGAGGDATLSSAAQVLDGATSGDLLANDDAVIGTNVRITGRVLADNANSGGAGVHGVEVGDSGTILGRIDAGGESPGKGDIDIGDYSQTESLYAEGNVTVLTNADIGASGNPRDIHGTNVVIGTGSEVWGDAQASKKLTNNGTIYGSTGSSPTAPDDYAFSLRSEPTFDETGITDLDYSADASLSPGTYRDLNVQSGVKLLLSAGTYYFRDITLASTAEIEADTSDGDVIIRAFSDLTTDGSNLLDRIGMGQVVIQVGDDLTIGASSTVKANLLAYSYDVYGELSIVTIGNDTWVFGMVYSEDDVIIGDRVVIPEPGTLVLLGAGAVCMMLSRHRRRSRA